MFTFVVNNDTMKVIGLINPCHKPNQKPAGSGPVSTSSFGPAAQAANSNAVPVSSNAHLAPDLIIKPSQISHSRLRSPRSLPRAGEGHPLQQAQRPQRASNQRRTKPFRGPFAPQACSVTSPELKQSARNGSRNGES